MFWIYVPPIILVAAIIGLVVMLGRKSADIQKFGGSSPNSAGFSEPMQTVSRSKIISQALLGFFEKLLILVKNIVKKAESIILNIAIRIKERRSRKDGGNQFHGSDIERLMKDQESLNSDDNGNENIYRPDAMRGPVKKPIQENNTEWIASEIVTRRKKPEETVVRQKETPAPENKMREDALIHRIAENPRDVEAYREIGDYYLSIGNIKDAKDSFKMVLKLRPRDLKAKSSLREIELRMRLGN